MKKKTKKTSTTKRKFSLLSVVIMALAIVGSAIAVFYTFFGNTNQQTQAAVVPPIPAGNLIQNPWFRSTAMPTQPGLDGWTDAAGTNIYWSTSQKDTNPSPDSVQGTSARWASGSGQGGGTGVGGVDAFLYQVVQANPSDTTLWFKTHWVTGWIEDANAKIYGSSSAEGPWTLLWTPLAVTQATTSSMAWTQTDLLSTQLSTGYSYYKIEFQGRYPANRSQGFKFTGVYFMSNDGTMPEDGDVNPTPAPEASPTPGVELSPTPTSVPQTGNTTPAFTTTSLTSGSVGGRYQSRVDASDADTNDTLNLVGQNLPDGITIGACQSTISGTQRILRCRLSGVPTTAGTYETEFTVTDSQGASATKTFTLVVE